MFVTIPEVKARLRDEAELAVMAFVEAGGVITRVEPSKAPVCVPVLRPDLSAAIRSAAKALLAA